MITKLYKMYLKSPLWVKDFVGVWYSFIPSKYKFGNKFVNKINEIEKIEYLSREEIKQLTDTKFVELCKYCYKYVPYYTKLFDDNGIDVNKFTGVDDAIKIPFTTKQIVKDNFNDFISLNVDRKKLKYITTGGTSGIPFGFYIDYDNDLIEWAYVTNIWKRVGYSNKSKRLVMRGKIFENMNKNIPWQYDSIKRELSISIFSMNDDNLKEYIRVINKYKPEYIHGYPSAIEILCKYINKNNIKLNVDIKAVLAVSENILDHQREFIERVLKTKVFSFYGHSERLIIAGECEYSPEYHVNPLYGYAEIVDNNGNIIKDNKPGELVGTGFNNMGMPLLRYKTGDIARWSSKEKCKCGRNFDRIEKIEGRWKQEMLIKSDGSKVSFTALNMHSDIFDKVKKFQLYQDKPGKVIIKIVKDKDFNKNDEIKIINAFKDKTLNGIEYSIMYVGDISTKSNGKYMFIDQQII